MNETAPTEQVTSTGFVLVELSGVLAHSAALTAELEDFISSQDPNGSAGGNEYLVKLQKLDLIRQLQGDIAMLLEEISRSVDEVELGAEELNQLISESKLGVVRNALSKCIQDIGAEQHTPPADPNEHGGVDLF